MKKLLCAIFNHKYRMDIYFNHSVQRLKCNRCGKLFGINHSVKALVDWDGELEEMHREDFPGKFKPK